MLLRPQALPHPNRRKYAIRVVRRLRVRESGGYDVDAEIELSGATLRVAVGMGAVDGALSERVVRGRFDSRREEEEEERECASVGVRRCIRDIVG